METQINCCLTSALTPALTPDCLTSALIPARLPGAAQDDLLLVPGSQGEALEGFSAAIGEICHHLGVQVVANQACGLAFEAEPGVAEDDLPEEIRPELVKDGDLVLEFSPYFSPYGTTPVPQILRVRGFLLTPAAGYCQGPGVLVARALGHGLTVWGTSRRARLALATELLSWDHRPDGQRMTALPESLKHFLGL